MLRPIFSTLRIFSKYDINFFTSYILKWTKINYCAFNAQLNFRAIELFWQKEFLNCCCDILCFSSSLNNLCIISSKLYLLVKYLLIELLSEFKFIKMNWARIANSDKEFHQWQSIQIRWFIFLFIDKIEMTLSPPS